MERHTFKVKKIEFLKCADKAKNIQNKINGNNLLDLEKIII